MYTTEQIYPIFLQHPGVVTDSRKVSPGVFFFALKGEHFDGNRFIPEALSNGCAYAVTDDPSCVVSDKVLLVADVLTALQDLARYHRRQLNIPVLAITGTNGKTTTKELMNRVLGSFLRIGATVGNLNNHIGVPLTLLSFTSRMQLGIVEMGANHPGEIRQLCEIAEPSHGIITNVGRAHLEGFGSFEGVKRTKELYDWLDRSSGVAFVNSDNEHLSSMLQGFGSQIISYGKSSHSCYEVIPLSAEPFLKVSIDGTSVETHLAGMYNSENVAAACCVGQYFGVPRDLILKAVEEYSPDNQRSQWISTDRNHLLCDLYNANPTSMQASVSSFLNMSLDPKCMILGDMLELGKFSREEHGRIAGMLESHPEIPVFWIGQNFSEVVSPGDHSFIFHSTEEVCEFLQKKPLRGFNILMKGSRGGHLERIIPFL